MPFKAIEPATANSAWLSVRMDWQTVVNMVRNPVVHLAGSIFGIDVNDYERQVVEVM